MIYGFDVLEPIDLVEIRQSNETTSSFYSIERIKWLAKKKVIMQIAKTKLELG